MPEPRTHVKRIVSKSEYTRLQARRTLKSIWAALLIALGILDSVITVLLTALFYFDGHVTQSVIWLLVGGASAFHWLRRSFTNLYRIEKVDVVPVTRANIAELPAAESLVRPSDQPKQIQKRVLLRAVEVWQDDHEEQLMRASTGNEECTS